MTQLARVLSRRAAIRSSDASVMSKICPVQQQTWRPRSTLQQATVRAWPSWGQSISDQPQRDQGRHTHRHFASVSCISSHDAENSMSSSWILTSSGMFERENFSQRLRSAAASLPSSLMAWEIVSAVKWCSYQRRVCTGICHSVSVSEELRVYFSCTRVDAQLACRMTAMTMWPLPKRRRV